MQPLTLTLIMCVTGDPSACQRVTQPGYATPNACLREAASIAAQFVLDHPAYRVAGARCGRAGR